MTEELSLTPIKEDKLAVTGGVPKGLEDYKPQVEWGYFKLDHKSGEIEYTLTGEKRKEWDVVVIDYSYSRILFPAGMGASEPICKTIEPQKMPEILEGTKYGHCIACPKGQWVDNKKPECKLSLNLSGLVGGEVAMPFSVAMRGASYKVGINLLNTFMRNQRSLYRYILKLSASDIIVNGSVEYRTFKFTEARPATEDEYLAFDKIHDQGIQPIKQEEGEVSAEKAADILGGKIVDSDEPF
jgi:hypothetical protein